MRLFLSRFAKMASLLMTSVAFLLSLTVNVFASDELSSTKLGFYQIDTSVSPMVYKRLGNSANRVEASDYDMGQMCFYGSRVTFRQNSIPVNRDFVQLTLAITPSAENYIPSEYREDFFGDLKYYDQSVEFYDLYHLPLSGVKNLNAIRTSTTVTDTAAILNIMLTKDELINISIIGGSASNRFYRFLPFIQISSNYMIYNMQQTTGQGHVVFSILRWSDTSDLVPIDEQTLRLLSQVQTSIDEGFTAVIDGQNHTNEKLDSIDSAINGNYVDPSDMAGIDSSIGDHSAAEAEVNQALSNIENMTLIDAEGNPIDVDLSSSEYFKNLENHFNFQLDGPAVTNSASIFRKTLTGYIGLFGSFIFFPLVLGILGALLGRPSGA